MVGAFITSAVMNFSMCRPEQPVSALDFMPNHTEHKPVTPERTRAELEAENDFELAVLTLKHQIIREQAERNHHA